MNHVPRMTLSREGRGFRKEVRSLRPQGGPGNQRAGDGSPEPRPTRHAHPNYTAVPGLEDGLLLHLDPLPTQLPTSQEMMTKAEGEGWRGADRPTEFRVQATTLAGLWNKALVHTAIVQMDTNEDPLCLPSKELCSES